MAKLTDFSGRPFSGIIPHAVIAVVVDNKDPDKLGRVKVKFPNLPQYNGADIESYWLRVATPNGGNDRGFYSLPEVEDEVLVLFIQGSQDMGVIIGQFWNATDVPPAESHEGKDSGSSTNDGFDTASDDPADGSSNYDKNDRRLWKSRSGHLIVMDDTDGQEAVQIWDSSRNLALVLDSSQDLVILSNTAGKLQIRSTGDMAIETKGNMDIRAHGDLTMKADGDFTLEAASSTQKVDNDYKVESSMGNIEHKASTGNIDVKTSAGKVSIDGLQVAVTGSAKADFSGGAGKVSLTPAGAAISGPMVSLN